MSDVQTRRSGCRMVPTGPPMVTSRFDVARRLHLRRLRAHGWLPGAAQGAHRDDAAAGARRDQDVRDARARGRRLPDRHEVGLPAARRVPPLPRRQRRRERTRHVQGPAADGARPAPADRGRRDLVLRVRRRPGVPLRARRDGARPGAHRRGAQRGLRQPPRRQERPRHRLLRRHHAHVGCRRLHRRRGDGADREPRGRAGDAAAEAAVLPGVQRPLHAADDRQQRRDARQRAVDRHQLRAGVPRRRRARRRPACGCSPSAATSSAPACSRCPRASPRSGC